MPIYHLRNKDGETIAFTESASEKSAIVSMFEEQGNTCELATKATLFEHMRQSLQPAPLVAPPPLPTV